MKILLTKHSGSEDALIILHMKDGLDAGGFKRNDLIPFADENQFIALRLDAAALLLSYHDSLQSWIIPNYQAGRGPTWAADTAEQQAMTSSLRWLGVRRGESDYK
ncbi:MAG: hypothetical protein WDN28_22355 [Chthoniobacter sp.]